MNDIWHYPRNELTSLIIDGMRNDLIDRSTIFAPRKSGKTEFILKDLLPLAEEQGMLVVYVDFWKDKTNPQQVFINAALSAITKKKTWVSQVKDNMGFKLDLGLDGFKVGIGAKSAEQALTLEQTFSALEACKADILLLLDEVQHLATKPDDESFTNFTAALRSFMANRSDKRVKGVFTGSSQDALSKLFASTDAPFYDSAQTLPFKPLSEGFVNACLKTFEKVTSGKQLSKDDALKVFTQLNSIPGRFINLLKQMALNMVYDINKGSELFTPEIMDAEVAAFQNTVQKLTEREMAVLVQLIQTDCKDPYSETNIEKLKDSFGPSASKSTIQNAMTKLSDLDIIYKAGHGEWRFSDPAFVKYIIMAK